MSIRFRGLHSKKSIARWWQKAKERASQIGLKNGPISAISIREVDGQSILDLAGGDQDLILLTASVYGNPIQMEAHMTDRQDLTPSHLLDPIEGQPPTTIEADMAEAQCNQSKIDPVLDQIQDQVPRAVGAEAKRFGVSTKTAGLLALIALLLFEVLRQWLF